MEFAEAAIYEFGDPVFGLVRGGFIKATSVGFIPIEFSSSKRPGSPRGLDFKRQELLEISICPIPANPNAFIEARRMEPRRTLNDRGRQKLAASRPWPPSRSARAMANRLGLSTRALVRAPAGLNEADPTASGFLIPSQFSEQLVGSLYEESPIAALCDSRPTDLLSTGPTLSEPSASLSNVSGHVAELSQGVAATVEESLKMLGFLSEPVRHEKGRFRRPFVS